MHAGEAGNIPDATSIQAERAYGYERDFFIVLYATAFGIRDGNGPARIFKATEQFVFRYQKRVLINILLADGTS
ncbi:hypothetical protein GZ78_25260 [Endozoicomonas numazuensis]|uniref:Uncharacterized protein n=1 Tax=Endozoicomonas numazuensis TaxID=1137799 RepID=A0A081N688_9GAMM|nr:hypothetical protein GZ78_25260 [Endozoicomonas numazuensis]